MGKKKKEIFILWNSFENNFENNKSNVPVKLCKLDGNFVSADFLKKVNPLQTSFSLNSISRVDWIIHRF